MEPDFLAIDFSAIDFSAILANYPAACRPTADEPIREVATTGFSGARLWRWAALCGDLVLRRWPREHPTESRLEWIHSVLGHLRRKQLAILAAPLATTQDQTFVRAHGSLWEIAPWLPGAALDSGVKPNKEQLKNAAQSLAAIHLAASDFPTSPTGVHISPSVLERLAQFNELASNRFAQLIDAVNSQPDSPFALTLRDMAEKLPVAAIHVGKLLSPTEKIAVALQPCFRDVWRDNILFVGDQVTGVVDYGAARIDSVATDVSRMLGSLAEDRPDDWLSGIAAYHAVRPLTMDEQALIVALDASTTLLSGCNWVKWLLIEGRNFPRSDAVISRLSTIKARLQTLAAKH